MNNSWDKFSHSYYQVLFLHVTVLFPHPHKVRYVLDERIIFEQLQPCRKCVSMWCQSVCKYKRLQCVLIEWKTDDSPISFETSLCTVFYQINYPKGSCNRKLGGHFLTEWAGCTNPNTECAITVMRALKSCNWVMQHYDCKLIEYN